MNRELQYIFTKYNMTVGDISTVHELLYNEFKEEAYWVTKNKNTGENLAREKDLCEQLKDFYKRCGISIEDNTVIRQVYYEDEFAEYLVDDDFIKVDSTHELYQEVRTYFASVIDGAYIAGSLGIPYDYGLNDAVLKVMAFRRAEDRNYHMSPGDVRAYLFYELQKIYVAGASHKGKDYDANVFLIPALRVREEQDDE